MTPDGQQQGQRAIARSTPDANGPQTTAMLSLVALCAVLAAGFVLAMGEAEISPALTYLISTILN